MQKSKVFKHTAWLFGTLIVIAIVALALARPMLAPGFNPGVLGIKSADDKSSDQGMIFSPENIGKIGEGVKADSFLVFNESSGQEIAAKNPNTPLAIASITKLMTAYVVQKYGNLDDIWAITPASTNEISPILKLKIGDRVKVQNLIDSMLVGSANDAAAALGQYLTTIKNRSIIDYMNDEAKTLGMSSTHYENPIGFDSEQNYSTATDLKLLLTAIRPLTLFSSLDREQSYNFTSENGNQYFIKATNTLISTDPEIHAIKTGFTDEAGGAMITAIYHANKKFVIIVLGSTNREDDTELLKKQVIQELDQ